MLLTLRDLFSEVANQKSSLHFEKLGQHRLEDITTYYNVLLTIFAPHLSVSARQSWSELCLFCKQLEFLFSAIPLKVVNLRIKCSFLEVYNENATQWQCLDWTLHCFAGTFCPEPELFDSLNIVWIIWQVRDLLRPDSDFLDIREDPVKGMCVAGWRSWRKWVKGKAGHADLFEHAKVAHIWDWRHTCQYMFCATPWESWHAKCPAIQEGKSKQI